MIDRLNAGVTVGGVVDVLGDDPDAETQAVIDEAVVALLEGDFVDGGVERVPAAA